MEEDDFELFEKLRNNIVKQSLGKVMSPIKEDANESVGLFKARSEEASGRVRSNSFSSKSLFRRKSLIFGVLFREDEKNEHAKRTCGRGNKTEE